MKKIFIISDDTRIEQERLFLDIVNKTLYIKIYYCYQNKKKELDRGKYQKISFLDYDSFILKLDKNKQSFIIYFNYYGNFNNFDFLDYNLIIFGHYLFYKDIISFKNLYKVKVFDFFRINKSKENIKKLFHGKDIAFISDINYPSAINMFRITLIHFLRLFYIYKSHIN